jgi:hypothetical protein
LKNLVSCARALLSSHEELIEEAAAEINLEEDITGPASAA